MALKRSAPDDDDGTSRGRCDSKRLKSLYEYPPPGPFSAGIGARIGLQRSLFLALGHAGFQSAKPEAIEGFTFAVETYMESFVRDLKRVATSARREHPTPVDFESTLEQLNLSLPSLRPHLHHPLPRDLLFPPTSSDFIQLDSDDCPVLPLLCEELGATAYANAKEYIPKGLPDLPSVHTFRYTPAEAGREHALAPAKIREEAAKSAMQGEDALRNLVRATKAHKQKEVRALAEKDEAGRKRYRLWDKAMKDMALNMGTQMGRMEWEGPDKWDDADSLDQSMIVNSEAPYLRREVARGGKRAGAGAVAVRNEGKVSG